MSLRWTGGSRMFKREKSQNERNKMTARKL